MRSAISLMGALLKQKSDPAEMAVKLKLRKTLVGCQSVLDIGCGASPTMRQLGIPKIIGVEGYKPSADRARQLKTHDEIIETDVRQLNQCFQPKQFDACVALDVIEHLEKADGLKLMQSMESIAKKTVIFFTPSGYLPQRRTANDDLQEHLSGWEPDEMRSYGYRVSGLLGPKKLRGEYHAIKGRPRIFWGIVSLAGHIFWTHNHPEKAAAILCIKDLA